MKKTLITIFAIIGVISTVLMLLGVGYILGTKDRTSAPVSTVTTTPEPTVAVETVAPTETPVPTSTPTPTATSTPSPTPTATSTPTPTATPTCTPSPTPSYTYTDITGMDKPKRALSEINVYNEPTKDSTITGKAPLDVIIEALQICNETGLMKVVYSVRGYGDVTGWVDPAYLVSAVENPFDKPVNNQTNKEENKTQEETTKPSTENTTKPSGNDSTAQKPTPTPKPSNPGHSANDPFYGSQFADYAPSGEKFTDTAIIDGVQTNISGTIKVEGCIIAEGIKNTGTPVVIQINNFASLNDKQLDIVISAYQYIYGRDEVEFNYLDESYTIGVIIVYPGCGNIIDSDIELNTH